MPKAFSAYVAVLILAHILLLTLRVAYPLSNYAFDSASCASRASLQARPTNSASYYAYVLLIGMQFNKM